MRPRSAGDLADQLQAHLVGDPARLVGPGVCIDSREITPGALFVALSGPNLDGHDYVPAAGAAGASAALVAHPTDAALPQLVVSDPLASLTAFASAEVRTAVAATQLLTVALTGSAGKTSTKDLLAQILAHVGPTVAPVRSFNNEFGVPVTAALIDDQTRFLVSEMGASAPGDIASFCRVVPPQVAGVLNVGTAHLGHFGSRNGIAQAKGEILAALPSDGWAVLNADDDLVRAMTNRTTARRYWFAASPAAIPGGEPGVYAREIRGDDLDRYSFELVSTQTGVTATAPVRLQAMGRHQVDNALAAAAFALAIRARLLELGTPGATQCAEQLRVDQIAAWLTAARVVSPWRMELHELNNGAILINDAVNANPASVRAAIQTLSDIAARRKLADPNSRAILVLGDMLELGTGAAALHEEVGAFAARCGIDQVIAIGEFAPAVVAGVQTNQGHAVVATPTTALDLMELSNTDVVLVKASRSMQLEHIAAALIERWGEMNA